MKLREMDGITQQTIARGREHYVAKGNEIIQKSHDVLTLQQQKVLCAMISKIKPDDVPRKWYKFSITEYCRLCNINEDSGNIYNQIKETIYNIDKQSIWIVEPNKGKETRLKWFNRLMIDKGSGEIQYTIHEDMFPYLLNLCENYTLYKLRNVLPLSSKYALRLYELLKSYEFMEASITFEVAELKKLLNAERYTNFKDFRMWALEPAIRQINQYTDIKVEAKWEKHNRSRSYNVVRFMVSMPTKAEQIQRDEYAEIELWY